jgi:altronate hydrolase
LSNMTNNALKVNPNDNVAIAIRQVTKGDDVVVDGVKVLTAGEDIAPSHKIALVSLKTGEKVIRYGEPIVEAKTDIPQGAWVHVHNTHPIERGQ